MRILVFCAFGLAVACPPWSPAFAQEGAEAGAARTELVMFEQTYCEWCKRWDEEIGGIYARTPEGRAAPLRRVDIHDDRPPSLDGIEGVVFTPTFVLVEDGEELGRIAGYPGEDFFWPMLDTLLEKRAKGAEDEGEAD